MRKYLLWWRNKPKEEKESIMNKHKIKAILYSDIKKFYLESL